MHFTTNEKQNQHGHCEVPPHRWLPTHSKSSPIVWNPKIQKIQIKLDGPNNPEQIHINVSDWK
jgi:hypothetical protein